MKPAAIVLLLLAGAACRSAPRDDPLDVPRSRDYLSLNRSSYAFLKDTARTARRDRKENLRRTLDLKTRGPENRRSRREGRSFFFDTLFGDELENGRNLIREVKTEIKPKGERMRSIRFGWLDSGD